MPLILIVIFVLALVAVGAFVYEKKGSGEISGANGVTTAMATVDGIEITKQQVDNRIERNRDALTAQGTDIDDPKTRAGLEKLTVEQLINETLVIADAERLGLSVTKKEISDQYDVIFNRFDSKETFQAELDKNRFTEESLRKNIERELLLQKYLQRVADADGELLSVTETEIKDLYDNLKAQNDSIPSLDEMRSQIEEQIRNQKLSQAASSAVNDLRTKANIVINKDGADVTPKVSE